jgi:hypothetical protein
MPAVCRKVWQCRKRAENARGFFGELTGQFNAFLLPKPAAREAHSTCSCGKPNGGPNAVEKHEPRKR